MKIVYVSNAVLPSEVSHSLSICRFCQALSDAGHEVTLIAVQNDDQNIDPISYYGLSGGFNITLLPLGKYLSTKTARRLMIKGSYISFKSKRIISEIKPDVIYSRLTLAELFFVPKNIPIIYEMHSLGFYGKHWLQRIIFNYLIQIKSFKRLIVTTDMLKDMISSHTVKPEITVARLSAELPRNISEAELASFKDSTLKGRNKFSVGYTGYLDNYGLRGTEIILAMANKMPNIDFHIVGGKPEMVEYWKERCGSDNVYFYGYMNPSLMPIFLSTFDVMVAPLQQRVAGRAPLGENMSPLKLSQYLAYGCSIVASDLPAHRELLVDGESAMLVPAADVDAWCNAVMCFRDNPAISDKLRLNARKYYSSNLTPQNRVNKILSGL